MWGWRISSFDRALARGTITSDVGTLTFDASVAVVDDFTVGEYVTVSLRRDAQRPGGFEVTRISPARFRAPFDVAETAPWTQEIAGWPRDLVGRRTWIESLDEGDLRLRVEGDSYEPERAIVFGGVVMIQGPLELDDLAAVRSFHASDVLRVAPELARHWPPIPERCVVFRIDPVGFGVPLYVVAERARLVVG